MRRELTPPEQVILEAFRTAYREDHIFVELDAKWRKAEAAIEAFSAKHPDGFPTDSPEDVEAERLYAVASDLRITIFRTPARTLRGVHIKLWHAAHGALSNRTMDLTPLSSSDAAYREVLREDTELYPLESEAPLLTLWADLERMLGDER